MTGPEKVFVESDSVHLWSTIIPVNAQFDMLERQVMKVAIASGERITGFTTGNRDKIDSFTMTRYPRKKYGITPVLACIDNAERIADSLMTIPQPDTPKSGFRAVLGLREGYDTAAPQHTAQEVANALTACVVSEADVFALRPNGDSYSLYTEPVAVVTGSLGRLATVYDLAHDLRQERFTVENFENMQSFTVETAHCTEPDSAF